MNLELLPNEILLDLFNYFDGVDLFRAFYGLNYRFNFLLDNQFRNYRFQFNSVSKRYFDVICQQHFPSVANRIIALSLSDYNETPGQINLFLSYIPSFSQFIRLQSLTIRWVRSYDTLMRILDECHHLCNLTHLNFYFCLFQANKTDFQLIINDIWNLPKLIHCNFGIDIKGQQIFSMPTIISSSLKCLSIHGSKVKLNQINRLFEYTPLLKRLSICTDSCANEKHIPASLTTLTALNINSSYLSDISKMICLLENMPNLHRLDISLTSNIIDGHQWEQIIRNYLPKLQVFRLKMTKVFLLDRIIQKQVDELINSFRNLFWIDEHQWFVRCLTKNKTIYLYTLSDTSKYYEEMLYDSWRSTYPLDDQPELDINITSIYNESFFEQPIPSNIRLSNIEYLSIKLPINDQFWSSVPSLKRLYSLKLSSYNDTFQSQLQVLLDRAPQLSHLTIHRDASLPWQMSLFKYTNGSVRRLDLINYKHCFTAEECITLSYSILGIHCEVLSILINDRECIIQLVKNMAKLQALHVQCGDEKYHKRLPLTKIDNNKYRDDKIQKNDDIVRWLKDRLPSTCSIIKNPDSASDISIWIQ